MPRLYQRGLWILRDLDAEHALALAERVESAARFRSVTELEEVVRSALPRDLSEAAHDVLDSLLALRAQLRSDVLDVAHLVERVSSSAGVDPGNEQQRATFVALLDRLLRAEAIVTTAAAADLLVQHEHPYRGARIISEIRPVFSQNVEEDPRAAVLIHTLQIGHWNADGSPDGLDIALDHADLHELHKVVERAMTKAETLRRFLETSGLESFDLGEAS